MPDALALPPRGRDAPLPTWLSQAAPPERPRFDSVVVRGNGIGALALAARLARSDSLRGKVRVAAPPPAESPRLVNGCTLRARSLDYLAACLGCDREALLERLFGARRAEAETRVQRFSVVRETRLGRFETAALVPWQGAVSPRPGAPDGSAPVFAYGLRNGHLAARLAEGVAELGVPFDDAPPESFEECRARAHGSRPLVVNGSPRPLRDLPPAPTPRRFVVASQIPLRRREDAPLPAGSSFIAARRRAGALDAGVFYPFVDPLTPAADFYGIFFRVVKPGADFAKAEEIAAMRRSVEGVAAALGCEAVDPEATRGEAMVPCLTWRSVPAPRADCFELHRTYSACTPIITGDGMTRAGLAAWVAAEAVLAGHDPVAVTNRSLSRWRLANRGFDWMLTWLSALAEPLMRRAPRTLLRPLANQPDMWAAVG